MVSARTSLLCILTCRGKSVEIRIQCIFRQRGRQAHRKLLSHGSWRFSQLAGCRSHRYEWPGPLLCGHPSRKIVNNQHSYNDRPSVAAVPSPSTRTTCAGQRRPRRSTGRETSAPQRTRPAPCASGAPGTPADLWTCGHVLSPPDVRSGQIRDRTVYRRQCGCRRASEHVGSANVRRIESSAAGTHAHSPSSGNFAPSSRRRKDGETASTYDSSDPRRCPPDRVEVSI